MGPGRVPRAWPWPVFAEAVEGRQGAGARTWQEWLRRRKGDERPTPAGAGGCCPQTSSHETLLTLLWKEAPQTQWLTPTIIYLSPYHFRLGSCVALLGSFSCPSLSLDVLKAGLGLPGQR